MATSNGGGLGYALMHAAQTWRTEASVALKPHGLTVPQFLVVMALYRQARHGWAPLTQTEVALRLGMDANTTSQVVRGLERRGVLTRGKHPDDARSRTLALTEDGLETARALLPMRGRSTIRTSQRFRQINWLSSAPSSIPSAPNRRKRS